MRRPLRPHLPRRLSRFPLVCQPPPRHLRADREENCAGQSPCFLREIILAAVGSPNGQGKRYFVLFESGDAWTCARWVGVEERQASVKGDVFMRHSTQDQNNHQEIGVAKLAGSVYNCSISQDFFVAWCKRQHIPVFCLRWNGHPGFW